jgi:hypothetical protein
MISVVQQTVDHLLFSCPIAKVVWGVVALCFHQNNRPSSYEQFFFKGAAMNSSGSGSKVHYQGEGVSYLYVGAGSNLLGHLEG